MEQSSLSFTEIQPFSALLATKRNKMYPWGKREFRYRWVKLSPFKKKFKPLSYSIISLKALEQFCNLWHWLQWKCGIPLIFLPTAIVCHLFLHPSSGQFSKLLLWLNIIFKRHWKRKLHLIYIFVFLYVLHDIFVEFWYLCTCTLQNEIFCLLAYFWETRQRDCLHHEWEK